MKQVLNWDEKTSPRVGTIFGTRVWTPEIFFTSERTVKFPSLFWNGVAENQPLWPWDRSTVFFLMDLSLRHGPKLHPRDQGRKLAISTFQFLKPLDFVMCSGWELYQTGKWSEEKLQILGFLSTWCLQPTHPEVVIQGQRQLSVKVRPNSRKMTLLEVPKQILFSLN